MPLVGNMSDRCKVLTHTAASTGPEPTSSYAEGSEIRCRYSRMGSSEVVDGGQMTPSDVEIRVPSGTSVTASDRIRLTKKEGATVSEDYAIVGEPWKTPGQIVLKCVYVSAGSVL